MIVDGRAIAEKLYAELSARRATFDHAPRLGVLATEGDPVIDSFVRIKTNKAKRLQVELHRVHLAKNATTEDTIVAIRTLALDVDGIIVQLPLPEEVDVNAALSAIPDNRDVDAISTATGEHVLAAPVALAVVEILHRSGIEPKGKSVAVVGAGRLVGAPVALLFKKLGAHVSILTLEKGSLEDLKTADIVVSGAGNPGFIKPDMLKHGVALIDAGTSEAGGKVVGDCDPRCADIASVFTPVPGGVGPIAVAMIFKNLFDLMEQEK